MGITDGRQVCILSNLKIMEVQSEVGWGGGKFDLVETTVAFGHEKFLM